MKGTDLIFRLWMPERKMMMWPKDIITFHEEIISNGPTIGEMKQWLYLQWSGFYDKHKKHVFNGDVVRLTNKDGETICCICKYGIVQRTMATGFVVDISGFYFEVNDLPTFPIINNYAGVHDCELFEIIGNIYENPELIKLCA